MQTPALSPEEYDVVALGSGEAGKFLAWTLPRNRKHAIVIERRYIGDSCPNIAKKERRRAGFRMRRFVGPKKTILERNDRLAHREDLDVSEALVWSQPLILPPRRERLDIREHARPACRFDQLSSARALVVHRRNVVGFLLARASQPLLRKPYRRDAYAPLLRRGISWACARHTLVRRENLISESHSRALPRCFNSRSPVQSTIVLDSTEEQLASAWHSCIERHPSNGDL
jgi:hypothetical protein